MKPVFTTITLFFFLFTFSTRSEPVLDISGEPLKAGESYYILSAFRERGGGLSFDTFGNDTCPHVVVQEKFELWKGKPVKFVPLNPKNHVVYTSRNLNIEFSDFATSCIESGVWKITKFISEALSVAIDGASGSGQDNVNLFKIEKAEFEGSYKLKYCPNPKFIVCQGLGVFSYGNDGKGYVGLANPGQFQQLRVVFQKADVKNAINDDVMSS